MLVGVLLLGMNASRLLEAWKEALAAFLSLSTPAVWEVQPVDAAPHRFLALAMMVLAPTGLMAAGVAGGALVAGLLQTGGPQVHPQLVAPKLDRISPISNARNLFSLRSAARLGKSMIPAALLAVFAVQRIAGLMQMPVFSTARLTGLGRAVYDLLLAAAWLLFSWAAIDYLVEWRSREQRLKMSREEMREEYKDSEGNPQIRARIRNLQRLARRRRMQADVARAAVVVTNPTHYAVALAFDFEKMEAPTVLAKGMNLVAEEIKQQARWAGVPLIENPPLAQSLYRLVEPGQSIPVELYAAVASILAFLYRQQVEQQMRQRRQAAASKASSTNRPARPASPPAVIPATRMSRPRRRPSVPSHSASGKGKEAGSNTAQLQEERSAPSSSPPQDRGES
jgi:flagellar biosynthesis protein FlhB